MWFLWDFVLLIVLIHSFPVTCNFWDWKIVCVLDDSAVPKFYLIENGTHSLIPNEETLGKILQKVKWTHNITTDQLAGFGPQGRIVPSLKLADKSPDEITRVELAWFNFMTVPRSVVSSNRLVGEYFNPSICAIDELYAMSYRGRMWMDDRSYITWVNASFVHADQTSRYGVEPNGSFIRWLVLCYLTLFHPQPTLDPRPPNDSLITDTSHRLFLLSVACAPFLLCDIT